MAEVQPDYIQQISDDVITIVWSDGHESLYFADHLRENCPCAVCGEDESQNESPFKIMGQDKGKIQFSGWNKVGLYAVAFQFTDGHTTGIYPYELLYNLCQCDVCSGKVIRIKGPFK